MCHMAKYFGQILGIGKEDICIIAAVCKGQMILPYRLRKVSSEDNNELEICCCKREEGGVRLDEATPPPGTFGI